jgi:5-methylcytosine-specific restriction endonuclease McrA
VGRCRAAAYELDPVSFVERRRRAEADRRVTLRPAPEVMAQLSALVPVRDGVAVWAVLSREAEALKAAGDDRSRGQIMADTLVHRVLGTQDASETSPPGLLVNVVVEDAVLLGEKDGFGWVEHYGEVPGDLLRDWLATHAETGVEAWVRRLYVTPATGELVAMDSTARRFEGRLAAYLRLRDRRCRTPYCDAPVRHLDHAHDHASGGPTSAVNGQGLCQACNHAKQARGWTARPRPGPRHTIETITPTGHRYTSTAPALTASERGLRIDLVLGA